MEVAFAVTQFNKLPEPEKKKIIEKLRSTDKNVRTDAAEEVGKLLCASKTEELTEFANQHLCGGDKVFDIYVPLVNGKEYGKKCVMIAMYFFENLPASGTEIPVPAINV